MNPYREIADEMAAVDETRWALTFKEALVVGLLGALVGGLAVGAVEGIRQYNEGFDKGFKGGEAHGRKMAALEAPECRDVAIHFSAEEAADLGWFRCADPRQRLAIEGGYLVCRCSK